MTKSTNSDSAAMSLRRLLEISAVAIAALTLLATLYFSVRSEKAKSLAVSVLSRRPLVTPGASTSSALQISYQGERVTRPWILSGRLQNTGSLPIEAREVETPVRLQFKDIRILAAEVSRKTPHDLSARIEHDTASASLIHGLLNPGDAIEFDVITDGEPILPDVQARISGVAKIPISSPPAPGAQASVTLWALPPIVQRLVLLFVSLAGAACILIGISGLITECSLPFRAWEVAATARAIEPGNVLVSLEDCSSPMLAKVRIVTADEFDNPQKLRAEVVDALKAIGATDPALVPSAIVELKDEIRRRVPAATARRLFVRLPRGVDSIVREKVSHTPFEEPTVAEYIAKIHGEVDKIIDAPRGWDHFEGKAVTLAVLMLLSGCGIGLIVGRSWVLFTS